MKLPMLTPIVRFAALVVVLALAAIPATAWAQNSPPARGPAEPAQAGSDAETLAWLIALNENEVDAAMIAEQKASIAAQKKLSEPVLAYAKMLHMQHAKGAQDTRELASKIGVTPAETAAVKELKEKGKQNGAKLAPLTGPEFERAFLDLMATGHREALNKVEGFQKTAKHDALKQHLAATRERVATHLKEAERLQSSRS